MPHAKTTHAKKPSTPQHVENSTDATRGEPLAVRAQQRKAELAIALEKTPADRLRERSDIEIAMASVDELLTGDPDHLTDATAAELSRWLEHTKHLAETAPAPRKRGGN